MKHILTVTIFTLVLLFNNYSNPQEYKIVDTGQETCYDTLIVTSTPGSLKYTMIGFHS